MMRTFRRSGCDDERKAVEAKKKNIKMNVFAEILTIS